MAVERSWGHEALALGGDSKRIYWARLAGSLMESSENSWPKIERYGREAHVRFGPRGKEQMDAWSQCSALLRLAHMRMRGSGGVVEGPMRRAERPWGGDVVLARLAESIGWAGMQPLEASEWVDATVRSADEARFGGMAEEIGKRGFLWTSERVEQLARGLANRMSKGASAHAIQGQAVAEEALSSALKRGKEQGQALPSCEALLEAWVASADNLAAILINAGVSTGEMGNAPKELAKRWKSSLKAGGYRQKESALAYAKACAMWESEQVSQAAKAPAEAPLRKKGARL